MQVLSSDGVLVEVHDLGGVGPVLLMSHATGFHGRVWAPVAARLTHRFHCYALDYRGHGDTAAPKDWRVDWHGYGDDATAVAVELRGRGAGSAAILGVGHSMGAACLLMAAHRQPEVFRGLVLYEPIVFPPTGLLTGERPSHLADAARRRRAWFPSFDDAIANYAAKAPLSSFAPEVLHAYVHGGFRVDEAGHVHLKCDPEHEAATFESGGQHRTWHDLPEIDVPVWVISGRVEPFQPSSLAEQIAERLPKGNYVQYSDLDHFGPMTDPARMARIIETFADTLEA